MPRRSDGVCPHGDCILWPRKPDPTTGYVRSHGQYAHRMVWEACFGPIPAGMEVDHTCRCRPCVNPDHLRLLTKVENGRLSEVNERRRARTHCPQGHPLDGRAVDGKGRAHRYCKTCHRDRERRRYAAKV